MIKKRIKEKKIRIGPDKKNQKKNKEGNEREKKKKKSKYSGNAIGNQ